MAKKERAFWIGAVCIAFSLVPYTMTKLKSERKTSLEKKICENRGLDLVSTAQYAPERKTGKHRFVVECE